MAEEKKKVNRKGLGRWIQKWGRLEDPKEEELRLLNDKKKQKQADELSGMTMEKLSKIRTKRKENK